MKKVGIVMGSDSDLPILRKTMDTLTSLGIPYECHIYSAHRTPEEARDFAVSHGQTALACSLQLPVWPRTSPAPSRQTPPFRSSVFPAKVLVSTALTLFFPRS